MLVQNQFSIVLRVVNPQDHKELAYEDHPNAAEEPSLREGFYQFSI
jgi:hypothetical protein